MNIRRTKKSQTATKKASGGTEKTQDEGKSRISRPVFVLIALVAVAFLIYSMVSIISIKSQIRERKAELDDLNEQITVQEIKNADIQKLYDSTGTDSDFSTLAEQIARDDLDYIKEGERVFVNVAGD
ncbi:MAG: septum formation initiator family protein [Ruminococcus sp.]|nr:septum formation initiator family protein [Ruminococcus sp.]